MSPIKSSSKDCLGRRHPRSALVRKAADYWMLTKPEVNFLVLISVLAGFYLGSAGPLRWVLLLSTLAGTLLVASGTATLNEYMERNYDAQMRRTAKRPLPAGRLRPGEGLVFGLVLSGAGAVLLAVAVNALASLLAVLTLLTYLAIYTPLKRKSVLCTLVGAAPGAIPPLIGWAAARGNLSFEAWVLYLMLFLWQFPHFMSIAWMYRRDYARAGYLMLPPSDHEGRTMALQVVVFSILLIAVSLIPALMGEVGLSYLLGAVILGLLFVYYGARLAVVRSNVLARRVLMASVIYLPLVYVLMMISKVPA
jgi:protoheme IX farnesyltransferase